MIRKFAILSAALIVAAGCARTRVQSAAGEVGSAVPATARKMPAGTELMVRTNRSLGFKEDKVGDTFSATVTEAVMAKNGQTVIPTGSMVYGHITGLARPSSKNEEGVIRLDFDRIMVNGKSHSFDANIDKVEGPKSPTSEQLKGAGIGGAAGAALGAIVSGGHLGAIVAGGVLGAAAGTVISLGMDKEDGRLPEGARMKLRASKDVVLQ